MIWDCDPPHGVQARSRRAIGTDRKSNKSRSDLPATHCVRVFFFPVLDSLCRDRRGGLTRTVVRMAADY